LRGVAWDRLGVSLFLFGGFLLGVVVLVEDGFWPSSRGVVDGLDMFEIVECLVEVWVGLNFGEGESVFDNVMELVGF
jgi:hypothetical protein